MISATLDHQVPPHSTVLVVNDNKDTVDILAAMLTRKSGMHVDVLKAYNGLECLELLRTHTVDLLILDDLMPVMDGFAVCAALQHTAAPPIIFVTGDDTQARREAALRLGARAVVVTPLNHTELINLIRSVLQQGGSD